jgi:hypothetical protein
VVWICVVPREQAAQSALVLDTRVESGDFCLVEQGREQVTVWNTIIHPEVGISSVRQQRSTRAEKPIIGGNSERRCLPSTSCWRH